MKAPTIYDVAKLAGVSKSLVSLVLRGSDQVSAEKREAVLRAVQQLNYTPSSLAAGLAGARTRSIGIIVDDFENLWFPPVLAGLRRVLADEGYSLSVVDTALNSHLQLDPLAVFQSQRVEGIVIAAEVGDAEISRLRIPAVILGKRSMDSSTLPVITGDEVAGGELATERLIELGHRDILCLSGPGASAAAREKGYVKAMTNHGLRELVLQASATTEAAARAAMAGYLKTAERPTAFFAVNDQMAVGAIGELGEFGFETPEDFSVIGYDNSPLADYHLISLTSVSGDQEELGERAGRSLLARIAGKTEDEPEPLTPKLIERESTRILKI